jgi:hypothetical protein
MPCLGMRWAADADELTPAQLGVVSGITPLVPRYPQASCDQGAYVIIIFDASGQRSFYSAGQFYSNCDSAPYPEISSDSVRALTDTLGSCPGALSADPALAPTVEADSCALNGSNYSGSSVWARFTVLTDTTYTASPWSMNGIRTDVTLLLYDSAGAAVLAESQPGVPLTVTEPGDYLLELRSGASGFISVTLELTSAPL